MITFYHEGERQKYVFLLAKEEIFEPSPGTGKKFVDIVPAEGMEAYIWKSEWSDW